MQLSGMNEISSYIKRSIPTVIELVATVDFPATKIGGVWESDTEMIDEWRKAFLKGRHLQKRPARKIRKRKS